jgi:hypothetical protein
MKGEGPTDYSGQLTIEDAERGFALHRSRQRGWRWWLLVWGLVVLAGTPRLERSHSLLSLTRIDESGFATRTDLDFPTSRLG